MANYPTSPMPSSAFSEEIEFRTNIFEAENGSEQRSKKWGSGRRKFTLQYEQQKSGEIWDFFKGRAGAAETFTFDPANFIQLIYTAPGPVECRFASDKAVRTVQVMQRYVIQVEILEVK